MSWKISAAQVSEDEPTDSLTLIPVVPDAAAVARVNQYTLKPLPAEEICVIEAAASDDQVDRDGEAMSIEILQDFADTAAGKAWMTSHSWGELGVGRITRGWLEEQGDRTVFMVEAYMLRADPEAAALIRKIEAGIAPYTSVGFYAPAKVAVRAVDGREIHQYVRGNQGEHGELLEVSSVFLGSNFNAQITAAKSAGGRCDCGRAAGACEVDAAVLETTIAGFKGRIRLKREDPSLVGESFAELHARVARLEREREAIA